MDNFRWQSATSLDDACQGANQTISAAMLSLSARHQNMGRSTLIKAGGVDLLDLMKEGLVKPDCLIDINELPELKGINVDQDGTTSIGALTTLADIATNDHLGHHFPALVQAAKQAASPQIRNRATIGGNLVQRPRCWYLRSHAHHCLRKGGGHCFAFSGDNRYHAIYANHGCAIVHASTPATPLLAYQAMLEIRTAKKETKLIPLNKFPILPEENLHRDNILEPGDIITRIQLPPHSQSKSVYLQVSERSAFDWPLAAVAITLELTHDRSCRNANIVLGQVASVPWRSTPAEQSIKGRVIDMDTAKDAGEAALTEARPLTGNQYKLSLISTLIQRALMQAAGA